MFKLFLHEKSSERHDVRQVCIYVASRTSRKNKEMDVSESKSYVAIGWTGGAARAIDMEQSCLPRTSQSG